MKTRRASNTGSTVRIREATPEDLPAWVEIYNRANPWEPPLSIEQARHDEASRDPSLRWLRLVAEENGRVVASGAAIPTPWWPTHLLLLRLNVDPDRQRRGIGSTLLERLLPFTRDHGTEVRAFVSEQNPSGIAFAGHHGFIERYRVFESALDVAAFDPAPYAALPQQLRRDGIHLTSLAAEDSPMIRRAVYDLWRRTEQDVPGPDPIHSPAFDFWERMTLEGPGANLETFVLARAGDHFVGLASMTTTPGRPAYNGFTAVDRQFRGKHLALTLKVQTILYARAHGIEEIRTNNHTTNVAMLAVNERLGYRRLPGRTIFGLPRR